MVCAEPLLTPAEAAHHRALWEACLHEELELTDGEAPPTPRGDAVNGYFKKYGGCYDLVAHPRVAHRVDPRGPRIAGGATDRDATMDLER